jgi:WD40 repeat protein
MSGSDAGDVTLWDIRRARNQLKSLKCESNANGRAHTGMIKSIKFSDDGLLLMTFGNDRMLRIWDGRNLSELRHATFPVDI